MKVLVADDQISTHQYLEVMIDWEELGINEIFHSYNGQETLDLLVDKKPDILILDIEMPKFNGIDVMKQIRDIYHPKTIIISAFDKFKYARDALELGVHNYILKPIDPDFLTRELMDLIETIKRENKQQIENKISRLINYGMDHEILKYIQNRFSKLGIEHFRVVYIKLLEPKNDDLLRIFRETLITEQFVIPYESNALIIVQSVTDPLSDNSISKIYEQLNVLKEKEHQGIFFGGSSPVESNIQELDSILQSSIQTARLGFYRVNKLHVNTNDQFAHPFDESFVHKVVQELMITLEMGYIDREIKNSIANIFDSAMEKYVEPINLYNFSFKLLSVVEQIEPKLSRELKINLSFEQLKNERRTIKELRTFILKTVDEVRHLLEIAFSDQAELLERIKDFVDKNYYEDISLNNISKKFHIDKYQLSKLFKDYFSINYWKYVTKVRMEKAAELLLNTDLKNYQIAEKVGYFDESHFSHAFKKCYGTSPRKYVTSKK